MHWLVYGFGVYLVLCYVWAIYLVVRLYTGKRLRNVIFDAQHPDSAKSDGGQRAEISQPSPSHVSPPQVPATDSDQRKAAA